MTTENMFNFLYLMMLFGAQGALAADDQATCAALMEMPDVTITYAVMKPATAAAPRHCYVQGNIQGRIRFHMQLPMRAELECKARQYRRRWKRRRLGFRG